MTKQINGKDVEVIQSHSWRGILDKMFKLQRDGYTVYESLSGHNSKSGTIIKLTMMKDQYVGSVSENKEQTSDLGDTADGEVVNQADGVENLVFDEPKQDSVEQANVEQKPAEPAKRGRKKAE